MSRGARSDLPIWTLTFGLAVVGAGLWASAGDLPELTPGIWWPLVALLYAASERFVVHLPFGREVHSLTFSQLPLVAGLLFLSTSELMLAAAAGTVVGNTVIVRRPPIKATHNLASTVAETAVEIHVFLAILAVFGADVHALDPLSWVATLAAVLVGDVFSSLVVLGVISLRRGQFDSSALGSTLASATMGTLVVTDLALVSILVARHRPAALVLLSLGLALTYVLYRGYHVQRLRYARLGLLYRFTSSVEAALERGTVEQAVRQQARELLNARHAEVVWLDDREPDHQPWWHPARSGALVRLRRGGSGTAHRALTTEGHADGMAAPLREGGDVVAVLLVTDRLDDVSTFDDDDGQLFAALAGSASVALANSRLLDRVRDAAAEAEHLSLHDPLTGLPNRLSFHRSLEQLLHSTGRATVLLMDLDRFKEVNDTLGHEVGDQLLIELAGRLRRLDGNDLVVARLGGDEFAVLLRSVDEEYAETVVAWILRALNRELTAEGPALDLSASIGIASSPTDGTSATTLLRRAEVAMYDSKTRRVGVARYSPDRDPYSSRRLTLIGDLARALENASLEVHYQPTADPQSGRISGVEALLRWTHPVWGNVPPDEFVALAEHTGLIRPLTRYVLREAVQQCVQWRRLGTPVIMSVNISARNLLEPELPADVARLLVQTGLPASLLKLEVTESALIAEPERSLPALHSLVDLGLAMSVDDFGTGHSSLARLRDLPVHEVKIDRAFVRDITHNQDDLAIVRAVIGLGHDLGLHVVAEGVEDEATWRLLKELDCDLVQGYVLARPMSGEDMTAWLRSRFAGFATPLTGERSPSAPTEAQDPPPETALGS